MSKCIPIYELINPIHHGFKLGWIEKILYFSKVD